MTIVRKLLDHITFTLNMDTKNIFHINDEYFLKKEQKEKDEFAIEFAKYISNNGYEDYWNCKKSWVSLIEISEVGEENAKKYTIKNLLVKYKKTL